MGSGIVDIANTSLIFWEIITFLILLALLYWFVYPPIRDQIRQRQQSIEQAIDELTKCGVRFEIYSEGDIKTNEKGVSISDKGPKIAWMMQ